MDSRSDAELVHAVLNGEKQAYAVIVTRHERAVRAAALTMLNDRHLAEDAAQEAFLRAYRRLGSLNDGSAFGPWVVRIARNAAVDVSRSRRVTKPLDAKAPLAAPEESCGLPDDETRQILSAVMRLPEAEWLVVVLRYFGGRSVEEIAAMTGRPTGTVTSQLSRARERLREQLKELADDLGS